MTFLKISQSPAEKTTKRQEIFDFFVSAPKEFKGAFNFSRGTTLTESLIKIYRRDKVLKFDRKQHRRCCRKSHKPNVRLRERLKIFDSFPAFSGNN